MNGSEEMTAQSRFDVIAKQQSNGIRPAMFEFRDDGIVDPSAWIDSNVALAKRKGTLVHVVVEVTPALAAELLKRNPGNRNGGPRESIWVPYSRDMAAGLWELNGEPVIVADDALLNDGQNRMQAVIACGRPIAMAMVFGVPRSSRMTVDRGAKRTIGHSLQMAGFADANNLAALAALVWQYENLGYVSRQTAERPTEQQVQQFVHERTSELADSLSAVGSGNTTVASKSVLAFCHHAFSQSSVEDPGWFIDHLITGEDLKTSSPVYVCRERLRKDRRLPMHEKVELIFRAFVAWRLGKRPEKLQILGRLPEAR